MQSIRPRKGWSDEAFTALFNALYPGLCRYLERLLGSLPSAGAAQEIAQEALLRLHQLGADGVVPGEERFWVYRVATRLALNEMRRARVRERLAALWPPLFGHPFGQQTERAERADEALEREEREDRIRCSLDALPPHLRAVLLLREYEELSYSEIATLLGISLAKTKTDLFRARRALRAALERAEAGAANRRPGRHQESR